MDVRYLNALMKGMFVSLHLNGHEWELKILFLRELHLLLCIVVGDLFSSKTNTTDFSILQKIKRDYFSNTV